MLRLLADENLDNTIIRGLRRRNFSIDLVRVQDVGLSGKDDPTVLDWAARENRILLTHDVATITRYAYERIAQAQPMSGVLEISPRDSIGRIIEDIVLVVECCTEEELQGKIYYLPFPS